MGNYGRVINDITRRDFKDARFGGTIVNPVAFDGSPTFKDWFLPAYFDAVSSWGFDSAQVRLCTTGTRDNQFLWKLTVVSGSCAESLNEEAIETDIII